jgi:glycerophosphoryl diester phosphodiesterase
MPENSLPAFEKAIDLGVHTLELDLAISKDKKVVVSHEPFFSRLYCLDPEGNEISKQDDMAFNLYEMTYDEIKQFDCGTKFHTKYPKQEKLKVYKPLLSEVIAMAETRNDQIKYNIEIKAKPLYDGKYTPTPKEFTALVLEVIKEYNVFNRVNLQSFDLRTLEEIHKQAPNMKVALLVDGSEDINGKLKSMSFKPEIISPYYKLLQANTVATLQSKEFMVIPWTVNKEQDMKLMIDYRVDGIITDYPNILIDLLKN